MTDEQYEPKRGDFVRHAGERKVVVRKTESGQWVVAAMTSPDVVSAESLTLAPEDFDPFNTPCQDYFGSQRPSPRLRTPVP